MKAQELYDLREATGFCNGCDLHRFFEVQTGNPSPRGDTRISPAAAELFVSGAVATTLTHAPMRAGDIIRLWHGIAIPERH